MKIDLLAISNNRINHLRRRLEFDLNEKERRATLRMLLKEDIFNACLRRSSR
jgi:hypothetical protein